MIPKRKFPSEQAEEIAKSLASDLAPYCLRIQVAGSLRRMKAEVGDIELVYIPRFKSVAVDLFITGEYKLTDWMLSGMIARGLLAKRRNIRGNETWGPKNKLAIHVPSGIPVDLFSTTEECWFNYLVCRTGSADNNRRIASAAQARGWKWHPYGAGFTDQHGDLVPVHTEQDVFTLLGLPYLEPCER